MDHDHLFNPQEFKYAHRSSNAPQFFKAINISGGCEWSIFKFLSQLCQIDRWKEKERGERERGGGLMQIVNMKRGWGGVQKEIDREREKERKREGVRERERDKEKKIGRERERKRRGRGYLGRREG